MIKMSLLVGFILFLLQVEQTWEYEMKTSVFIEDREELITIGNKCKKELE
jgi:hypothetical protein